MNAAISAASARARRSTCGCGQLGEQIHAAREAAVERRLGDHAQRGLVLRHLGITRPPIAAATPSETSERSPTPGSASQLQAALTLSGTRTASRSRPGVATRRPTSCASATTSSTSSALLQSRAPAASSSPTRTCPPTSSAPRAMPLPTTSPASTATNHGSALAVLEHRQIGLETRQQRRHPERERPGPRGEILAAAEVEARVRARGQPACALVGERRLEEARLEDRQVRREAQPLALVEPPADVGVAVRVDERGRCGHAVFVEHAEVGRARIDVAGLDQPGARETRVDAPALRSGPPQVVAG